MQYFSQSGNYGSNNSQFCTKICRCLDSAQFSCTKICRYLDSLMQLTQHSMYHRHLKLHYLSPQILLPHISTQTPSDNQALLKASLSQLPYTHTHCPPLLSQTSTKSQSPYLLKSLLPAFPLLIHSPKGKSKLVLLWLRIPQPSPAAHRWVQTLYNRNHLHSMALVFLLSHFLPLFCPCSLLHYHTKFVLFSVAPKVPSPWLVPCTLFPQSRLSPILSHILPLGGLSCLSEQFLSSDLWFSSEFMWLAYFTASIATNG